VITESLFCAGPGDLLCRFYGARLVRVGGQFIPMGVGMRSVLFWERRLFYRLMLRVRERPGNGMMPGIFQLAVPILAGTWFYQGGCISLVSGDGLSW
jgi:hypothetical protein